MHPVRTFHKSCTYMDVVACLASVSTFYKILCITQYEDDFLKSQKRRMDFLTYVFHAHVNRRESNLDRGRLLPISTIKGAMERGREAGGPKTEESIHIAQPYYVGSQPAGS